MKVVIDLDECIVYSCREPYDGAERPVEVDEATLSRWIEADMAFGAMQAEMRAIRQRVKP